MAKRFSADWETIEREYRAGQFSVREIAAQADISHTAINKRARAEGWVKNPSPQKGSKPAPAPVSSKVSRKIPKLKLETAPSAKKQQPPQLQEFAFQPGQSGNPSGRPKGSRNKLGEAFIQALYEDFTEHGPEVIKRVRAEKPDVYLKVTASILPKHVQIENKSDMTDDELNQRLGQLAEFLDFAVGTAPGNAGTAGGKEAKGRAH